MGFARCDKEPYLNCQNCCSDRRPSELPAINGAIGKSANIFYGHSQTYDYQFCASFCFSARRRLLQSVGINPLVCVSHFDESQIQLRDPVHW